MTSVLDLPYGYRLLQVGEPTKLTECKPRRWAILAHPPQARFATVLDLLADLSQKQSLFFSASMTPSGPAVVALQGQVLPIQEMCTKSGIRTGFYVDNPGDETFLNLVAVIQGKRGVGN